MTVEAIKCEGSRSPGDKQWWGRDYQAGEWIVTD